MFKFLPFTLVLVSAASYSQPSSPLFLRSQTMAQFFRAAPNPPIFEGLQPGNVGFRGSRAYANFWGNDKRYIIDGQTIDDNAQIKVGIFENLSLTIEYSQRQFTDTPMDQVAIQFHEVFQLPQDKRLTVKRNGTRFSIPDYGLEITEDDLFEPVSEQFGLKVEKSMSIGRQSRLAMAAQMSQENSKYSLINKGARDFGLQLGLKTFFDFGYTYTMINGMFFDQSKDSEMYLRSRQASVVSGLGLPIEGVGHFLLQALVSESPYRDIGQLSKSSYEIHLGYRYSVNRVVFELGFIENVIWPFNTPDWGLSFGVSYNLANSPETAI